MRAPRVGQAHQKQHHGPQRARSKRSAGAHQKNREDHRARKTQRIPDESEHQVRELTSRKSEPISGAVVHTYRPGREVANRARKPHLTGTESVAAQRFGRACQTLAGSLHHESPDWPIERGSKSKVQPRPQRDEHEAAHDPAQQKSNQRRSRLCPIAFPWILDLHNQRSSLTRDFRNATETSPVAVNGAACSCDCMGD